MKPSTSLTCTSKGGITNGSPAMRQRGNIGCLLARECSAGAAYQDLSMRSRINGVVGLVPRRGLLTTPRTGRASPHSIETALFAQPLPMWHTRGGDVRGAHNMHGRHHAAMTPYRRVRASRRLIQRSRMSPD